MTRPRATVPWVGLLLAALLTAGGCGSDDGPRSAADLYADFCSRCHGADGKGDRQKRRLNPGLDLTASAWVAEGARGEVRQRIADGHGSMPGFAKKLTPEEIDAVTAYLDRFRLPGRDEPGTAE